MKNVPVLDVRNLSVSFSQYTGMFHKSRLQVVDDLSLRVFEREIVAVVGASGSGKSLLAHAVMGILPGNACLGGQIFYRGEYLTQSRMEKLRGREILLVPQGVSYLDPLMKVGKQLRKGSRDPELKKKAAAILEGYGLGAETEQMYPFELSGGMTRRVMIATAVMETPKLVIADEPTPGLHASVARRVLGHFREIADQGAAVLLITHDLALAAEIADRVVVFYSGTTVEEAGKEDFLHPSRLRHPYTKGLWHAMPKNGFQVMEGMPTHQTEKAEGCPFRKCCDRVGEECAGEIPYRRKNGGYVRCAREEGI